MKTGNAEQILNRPLDRGRSLHLGRWCEPSHLALLFPSICAGSAGNGERALRVSVDAALRAGIFKASGSFDPMGFGDGRREWLPRPWASSRWARRAIPRQGCFPAEPASVSPGNAIV